MQQISATAPTAPRTNFNLSAASWTQHGRGLNGDAGIPVRARDGLGIITDFPWSDKPDPTAGPNWNGYLVNQISGNLARLPSPKPNNPAWNLAHPQQLLPAVLILNPQQHLVYEFEFALSDGAALNFMSDANNTDKTTPPGFRPFLKSDAWEMMGNRWWCRQRWALEKTDGIFRLDVSLDPANWFDVSGAPADGGPAKSGYFDALARPTYIGLTFGGGYFAGHGVCVSNGNAAFALTAFYTY